jgi:hypothetical protein
MTKAARISLALALCFFALSGVIFASAVVAHKRTVQEADFWLAAGCDEVCLHRKSMDEANATPRVSATMDISDLAATYHQRELDKR